jgi:acetyl esterase/lipase
VEVRLIVGEGQTHCYPLMPDFIPEAKYAMREIRAFVQKHTAS